MFIVIIFVIVAVPFLVFVWFHKKEVSYIDSEREFRWQPPKK